mmetsp:Transcript_10511/g.32670  ORF Transcript_10511/g.32670 Transcript_10511/m.32670 type:complete len:244 (-) Transcript_10511:1804-2535(-)
MAACCGIHAGSKEPQRGHHLGPRGQVRRSGGQRHLGPLGATCHKSWQQLRRPTGRGLQDKPGEPAAGARGRGARRPASRGLGHDRGGCEATPHGHRALAGVSRLSSQRRRARGLRRAEIRSAVYGLRAVSAERGAHHVHLCEDLSPSGLWHRKPGSCSAASSLAAAGLPDSACTLVTPMQARAAAWRTRPGSALRAALRWRAANGLRLCLWRTWRQSCLPHRGPGAWRWPRLSHARPSRSSDG